MVGRIITKLNQRGRLREAPTRDPWQRRRSFKRPYGIRKPKDYLARAPGDIVQIDTADIQLFPGFRFKHFTACDVFTRCQVLEAYSRATEHAAAGFLDTLLKRLRFPVRAIQVDGGSEFMAQFELACQKRGIRLFVLPPRSPKLNGHVERAQRTHREEFYRFADLPTSLKEINKMLRTWERVYNNYRPHQALRYLTPNAFYQQHLALERSRCPICLDPVQMLDIDASPPTISPGNPPTSGHEEVFYVSQGAVDLLRIAESAAEGHDCRVRPIPRA